MGSDPIVVGQTSSIRRFVTMEMVRAFAELVGDTNPVHLDEEYAASTRFERPVIHGALASAFISTVLGTRLPGPGCIYLGQTTRYLAPIYPGEPFTVTVHVLSIRADKPIVTLRTVCTKDDGVVAIDGEAVVLVPWQSAGSL